MSPRLAKALEHAEYARTSRERLAAAGCCPTCWRKIPGLEPVESRPRPWTYCEWCRDASRERAQRSRRAA